MRREEFSPDALQHLLFMSLAPVVHEARSRVLICSGQERGLQRSQSIPVPIRILGIFLWS